MDFRIEAVDAAAVRPLRQTLLRPTQPPEELVYGGDDDADTLHVAGFVGDRMVGIASVSRQPFGSTLAYRLRGMGTVEDVRGLGYGRELLDRCLAFAAEQGVGMMWCNARMSAVGFYAKAGFITVGKTFELPDIGPHVVMLREL